MNAKAISCTSFPVRLTNNVCQDHDAYNSFSAGKYPDGIDPKGFAYGAFAWANMQSIEKGGCDKNYWVIHGCDYTGLQMCDCGGQAGIYIENIGPVTDECDPNDHYEFRGSEGDWLHPNLKRGLPYPKDECVTKKEGGNYGCCDGTEDKNQGCTGTDWSNHQKTWFAHPGTGYTYSTYWSGWWTPGTKDHTWNDCGIFGDFKPWCNTMVQYDNGSIGPIPEDPDRTNSDCMFAMIYPWVCSKVNYDTSFYWGDEGSWPFGLPYGDETYKVQCWADNEPWDRGTTDGSDTHFKSDAAPPAWKAMKFCKNGDKLDLWTVYEKKPQWSYGKYVDKHEVLVGQSDAGVAYGGQGSFPY